MRLYALKRVLLGRPLPTAQARHERLSKRAGLAVFASDNLSSVAYATEEILRVLLLAGVGALALSVPIACAIAIVIAIVILSYRETILAYPEGASDYIVAKDNMGTLPGLTAGGALLIDYTLTVAVSVSAGIAALTSAVPGLYPYRVTLCVGAIALVAIGNLRGLRESGRLFAAPSYLFIAGIGPGLLILVMFSAYSMIYARIKNIPTEPKASWRERLAAIRGALWPLGFPAIVVGGIYGGVFSPTEAASVCVLYALLLLGVGWGLLSLRALMPAL